MIHAPKLGSPEKNIYLQISIKHCNIELNSNLIVSIWCMYMLYAVLFNSTL